MLINEDFFKDIDDEQIQKSEEHNEVNTVWPFTMEIKFMYDAAEKDQTEKSLNDAYKVFKFVEKRMIQIFDDYCDKCVVEYRFTDMGIGDVKKVMLRDIEILDARNRRTPQGKISMYFFTDYKPKNINELYEFQSKIQFLRHFLWNGKNGKREMQYQSHFIYIGKDFSDYSVYSRYTVLDYVQLDIMKNNTKYWIDDMEKQFYLAVKGIFKDKTYKDMLDELEFTSGNDYKRFIECYQFTYRYKQDKLLEMTPVGHFGKIDMQGKYTMKSCFRRIYPFDVVKDYSVDFEFPSRTWNTDLCSYSNDGVKYVPETHWMGISGFELIKLVYQEDFALQFRLIAVFDKLYDRDGEHLLVAVTNPYYEINGKLRLKDDKEDDMDEMYSVGSIPILLTCIYGDIDVARLQSQKLFGCEF